MFHYQGPDSLISWLLFLLFFFIYPLLYPRIIISQAVFRLSQLNEKIGFMVNTLKKEIVRKSRTTKPSSFLNEVLEFFTIEPVDLDPFGIIRKWEKIIDQSKEYLEKFVDKLSPKLETEKKRNIIMGLNATISLYQIYKLINHYINMLIKTKNFQLAFLIQMQIPLIERVARAVFKGGKMIIEGYPIGDSIGPLAVTQLISKKDRMKEKDDCIIIRKRIGKKEVFILRSKGPGSRIGKFGRIAQEIIKKYRIKEVITVDAAAKLEGEKTGSIAEGVGVAIGGIGVDKALIEEITTKKDIELKAIIIKMSNEEAIKPMHPDVFKAAKVVKEKLLNLIKDSANKRILIIGVGNSVGIPNTMEEINEKILQNIVEENWKKYGKEKIKKSWIDRIFGF